MSGCHVAHGLQLGFILSGHLTRIALPVSGQLGQRYTIAPCPHVLQVIMTPPVHMSCRPCYRHNLAEPEGGPRTR
jgi:hypothetical protein